MCSTITASQWEFQRGEGTSCSVQNNFCFLRLWTTGINEIYTFCTGLNPTHSVCAARLGLCLFQEVPLQMTDTSDCRQGHYGFRMYCYTSPCGHIPSYKYSLAGTWSLWGWCRNDSWILEPCLALKLLPHPTPQGQTALRQNNKYGSMKNEYSKI